ncbi:hypothetical protein CJ030_MR2G023340 [Morella rubra]|uniref:Uncharacterized protein n=1 Tax=Morella rubra TaxID=262757 RepID=A0A6A1WG97_9ROSI|nr:hypothetical protein CJ030_MR2G023340 [Morella rubra]
MLPTPPGRDHKNSHSLQNVRESRSPRPISAYYLGRTVSEARFVRVGYGNFVGGNAADIVSYPMATEFGYNTNLGNRVSGNAADFGQSRVARSLEVGLITQVMKLGMILCLGRKYSFCAVLEERFYQAK